MTEPREPVGITATPTAGARIAELVAQLEAVEKERDEESEKVNHWVDRWKTACEMYESASAERAEYARMKAAVEKERDEAERLQAVAEDQLAAIIEATANAMADRAALRAALEEIAAGAPDHNRIHDSLNPEETAEGIARAALTSLDSEKR